MATPAIKDWAKRSGALSSITGRSPGGAAWEGKIGPSGKVIGKVQTQAGRPEVGGARPEPKFHKGQQATIKGYKGTITDVMWDSKRKVWTYSIQVWISGDEAEVKP